MFPYYGATGEMDTVDDYIFEGLHLLVAEDGSCETPDGRPYLQLVTGRFWVNNHAHVIRADSELETRYIYYALSTISVRPYLSGSVQAKLSQANLNRITVPYFGEQGTRHAIAEVLGALDDKIEANSLLARCSDSLASVLLEEALGRAGQDGSAAVTRLGEVADVNAHTIKPSAGEILYQDIASAAVGEAETPTAMDWSAAPSRARRAVRDGDTLWSTVRPNRRSHFLAVDPPDNLVASTGFAVLTPVSIGASLLYGLTEREEFVDYLVSSADGSAYPAVRAERFVEAPLVIPSATERARYEATTMPLRRKAHAARVESQTLAALRDVLIPSLLSGDLRVDDTDQSGSAVV
jgi:type I restriction enzyme S subunit